MQELKDDITELRTLTGANTSGVAKLEAIVSILTDRIQGLVTTVSNLTQTIQSNEKYHTREMEYFKDSLEIIKQHGKQLSALEHWQAGQQKWGENVIELVTENDKRLNKHGDSLDARVDDLEAWKNKKDGGYAMLALGVANILTIVGLVVVFFRH